MISEKLRNARSYEVEKENQIGKEIRPEYHLSTRVGWMNDPNGFSYYNGMYHLFYQYYPYDTHWGPMHWGHATSKDLLHWEYLPAAIAPDMPYDQDGCFSGSAVELPDGRQLLMYTGVRRETQPDGEIRDVQTQCIAIGDGLNYEKYEGNPVLTQADLPEGGSRFDFRDPKLWREADGTYACVVANCDEKKDGRILLYRSQNALEWHYDSTLRTNNGQIGKMWECPDYFQLDGKDILIASPQELMPERANPYNGNVSVAFIEKSCQLLDYGIDFYAPQTIQSQDGRRIMIGWMQNWDTSGPHRGELPWFGQMSFPRELTIRDGKLIQKPIKELEQLRQNKVAYENVLLAGSNKLEGIQGRKAELELEISSVPDRSMYQSFTLQFAQNKKYYTCLNYRPHESVLEINRTCSGARCMTVHQRSCKVTKADGKIKLRVLLDQYSAEVFVNDGEQVLSVTMYTNPDAEDITFVADGSCMMNVTKYELNAE